MSETPSPEVSTPLTVRPLRLDLADVAALMAVERASLNDSHYSPEQALKLLRRPGRWIHLACDGQAVVGFCFSFATRDAQGPRLEIDMLGVVPSHRRRGLATRLIGAALADGRERRITRARGVVACDNVGSRRAFRAAGMVVGGQADLLVYDLLGAEPQPFLPAGWTCSEEPTADDPGSVQATLRDGSGVARGSARWLHVRTLSYSGIWIEDLWANDPESSALLSRAAVERAKREGLDETGILWPKGRDEASRLAWLRQGYERIGDYDLLETAP